MAEKLVSIIIPSYGFEDVLLPCLDSLKKNTSYPNYEVILIDDSGDPKKDLRKYLKKFDKYVYIKHEKNMGYPVSVNDGITKASGAYLFFSNDDFRYVDKNWLTSSVVLGDKNRKIGVIGWKLLLPNGTIQTTGGILRTGPVGRGEKSNNYTKAEQRDFTNGLIKRELIDHIGYFDEGFTPGYYEDMDFCYRAIKAGYVVMYNPKCIIMHDKSATMSKIRDDNFLYTLGKNKLRYMLLNYTLEEFFSLWLMPNTKKKTATQAALKKESVGGMKSFRQVLLFARAISTNLKNLPEIIYMRANRTRFLGPTPREIRVLK